MGRAKKVKYSYYGGYVSEFIYIAYNNKFKKLDTNGNERWSVTTNNQGPTYIGTHCDSLSYDNQYIILGMSNNNVSSPAANGDIMLWDTDGNFIRSATQVQPYSPESYGNVRQVYNNLSNGEIFGLLQQRYVTNYDINFSITGQYDAFSSVRALYGNGVDKLGLHKDPFAAVSETFIDTTTMTATFNQFQLIDSFAHIWSDQKSDNRFYYPFGTFMRVYTNTGSLVYTKTHGADIKSTYSDSDGNFYLTGASASGCTVRKYNSTGTETLTLLTPGTAYRIRTGTDGSMYINWVDSGGYLNLSKYNVSGTELWTNQYEIIPQTANIQGGGGLDIQLEGS